MNIHIQILIRRQIFLSWNKSIRVKSRGCIVNACLILLENDIPLQFRRLVGFLCQEDPLEKGQATHSSILGASLVAQLVKNPPAMLETWVQSLGWEGPLEKRKATHCSILAQRIPGGHKESDTTERLSLFQAKNKKSKSNSGSVVSNSLRPHRLQSDNLLCPWDFLARIVE